MAKKTHIVIGRPTLGKITHFRKSGIAVPLISASTNLKRLEELFTMYDPLCVCFLGDLFHSVKNGEWSMFGNLLASFPTIEFELVLGNHDILNKCNYAVLKLKTYKSHKIQEPFVFSHEPLEEHALYNIAGHIHPSVKLKGNAKSFHKAACFIIGHKYALLPSFGNFTGSSLQKVNKEQRIFVLAANKVIEI